MMTSPSCTIVPGSPLTPSTLRTWSSATRYCLPPALMTANIVFSRVQSQRSGLSGPAFSSRFVLWLQALSAVTIRADRKARANGRTYGGGGLNCQGNRPCEGPTAESRGRFRVPLYARGELLPYFAPFCPRRPGWPQAPAPKPLRKSSDFMAWRLLRSRLSQTRGASIMIRRRDFIIGAGAAAIAGPAVLRAAGGHHHQDGRAEAHPFDRAALLREVHAGRLQGRGHPVREPDRGQERGRHQVGRFRHVRHRRGHARRGRRRADRGDRRRLQQGHGGDRQEGRPDRLDQGPEGQARSRSGRARRRRCSSSSACGWRACRSRTSRRSASRSAKCISRSRAATSTPMSAPSPAPASASRPASASLSNIRTAPRWAA